MPSSALPFAAGHVPEALFELRRVAVECLSNLCGVNPLRRLSSLDGFVHALKQIEIVLVTIGLEVEVGWYFGESLVADRLDMLLHEAVVVAPQHAGSPDRRLLGAAGNLVGVQIVQVELIDKHLLDLLVQDQEAVSVDLASAKFHGARHVAVDIDGFAVIAVAGKIRISCWRSRFLTRRSIASTARSSIRLEMYHSGIRSFLCGALGWQKCRGIAALSSDVFGATSFTTRMAQVQHRNPLQPCLA